MRRPFASFAARREPVVKHPARIAALAVAATVAGLALTPAAALAKSAISAADWAEAVAAMNSPSYSAYSSTTDAVALSDGAFPEKYDLRDPDGDGNTSDSVVTPVKFQNPWGTCWGFSAIAASETSILSSMQADNMDISDGIDLSERHLTWFAYSSAPESVVGSAQAGEGFHNDTASDNYVYNLGGLAGYATSVFASGIGPVQESDVPYKNEEDIVEVKVVKDGIPFYEILGLSELEGYAKEHTKADGYTLSAYYSETLKDETTEATWKVDDSYYNVSAYELEESHILPECATFDESSNYSLNQEGVDAIKSELLAGRAVSIAYRAESSYANEPNDLTYFNIDTWSSYTDIPTGANHAVTIVGYDDTYSAENFIAAHRPDHDGAWLVKNSWGSEDSDFPNENDWGIVDEKTGKHTGYFWLSYYDQTICCAESFVYDLDATYLSDEFSIDQYDYLVDDTTLKNEYDEKTSSANVFVAEQDQTVRALTCRTVKPNTTVTYEVYLLDDDAKSPTDGKLVATVSANYQYGGFHRAALDEKTYVPMREGQRYSVVTTQHCETDGKYYICASTNQAKLTEEHYDALYRKLVQQKSQAFLEKKREAWVEQLEAFGSSREEAEAQAAKELAEYMSSAQWDEDFENIVEPEAKSEADTQLNTYYVAKVNPGESYVATDGSWEDWSTLIDDLAKDHASAENDVVIDNMPIKAYAELKSFASVDELKALAAAIERAKAALAGAKISADGSDVDPADTWMTQAAHDALAAAIEEAELTLAEAGADYATTLAADTPDSEAVRQATSILSTDAVKAGTKQAAEDERPAGEQAKDERPASEQAEGGHVGDTAAAAGATPKTGDAGAGAPAAAGLLGIAALLASKRRAKD